MQNSSSLAALRRRLAATPLAGLSGCFHSHITVRATPQALRDFCRGRPLKPTIVDLDDFHGRHQRDVMTTAYHNVCGDDAIQQIGQQLIHTVEALQEVGIEVLRVKLEHEDLPTVSRFCEHHYREIHIKLSIDEADYAEKMQWLRQRAGRWGYVPSRNPFQRRQGQVLQFVNLRLYDGDLEDAARTVEDLSRFLTTQGDLRIAEIKQETAVIDTARDLDRWWA